MLLKPIKFNTFTQTIHHQKPNCNQTQKPTLQTNRIQHNYTKHSSSRTHLNQTQKQHPLNFSRNQSIHMIKLLNNHPQNHEIYLCQLRQNPKLPFLHHQSHQNKVPKAKVKLKNNFQILVTFL